MVSNSLRSINCSRWGNSSVRTPWGFSRIFSPSTKSFRSGTCARTLLPRTKSAQATFACEIRGKSRAEKANQSRHAFLDRYLGHICGRLNAQHWHLVTDEILQQVAVIARDFYDEALFVQTKPLPHALAVSFAVLKPRIRIGREIRVVAENLFCALVLIELHQEAALANINVQRIIHLGPVKVRRRRIGLTKRRHPQIDECSP